MCSNCQSNKIAKDNFIEKSIAIHGDKYGYDRTNYITSKTNVDIFCKTCNVYFTQLPHNHLNGKGCRICAMKSVFERRTIKNNNALLDTSCNNEKSTSIVNQIRATNVLTKVTTHCQKHGDITLLLKSYNKNKGCCSRCLIEDRKESRHFQVFEKLLQNFKIKHENKYNYGEFKIIKDKINIDITCGVHGKFTMNAHQHSAGANCPKCARIEASKKAIGFTKEGWLMLGKENYQLYLMDLQKNKERFYKIGITTDFKERSKHIQKKYKCLNYSIIESSDGGLIYDLEKELHKKFDYLKYNPKTKFNGWTECFNLNDSITDHFNFLKHNIENGIPVD